MVADKIRVTVDGEPVAADVSWDDVRAYLRAKGWTCLPDDGRGQEWWDLPKCPHRILIGRGDDNEEIEALQLEHGIAILAHHERRRPAVVLREIARVVEPTTAASTANALRALRDILAVCRDRGAFVLQGPRAFAKAEQIARKALADAGLDPDAP